ncbi:MAG: GTP cyclohydrolase I FolE [Bryobacteraceae bacterium]
MNSNSGPTISGAMALPLSGNEVPSRIRSPFQVFRSLVADLRQPLRTGGASRNGHSGGTSDRTSLAPSVPPPPPQPLPRDLSTVDSKELIREILRRIGEDPDREGLQQTPDRIVRSWKEIYGGYARRAEDVLVTQFQAEQYDQIVLLRDINFFSTCEHHMLPFHGKVHIAYLPNDKIVGLSKLARLTEVYARRLQVQERLTYQVATELQRVLEPKGVAVMIEAMHQCMCSRGVRKRGGTMVTSCLLGAFKDNLASRTEFLALVKS